MKSLDYADLVLDQCDHESTSASHRLMRDDYLAMIDQIAHDIRNPVAVIGEYTSLLREGLIGTISEPQREVIEIFSARADEIHLLIGALQTLAKLDSGLVDVHPHDCDFVEIVEGVAGSLRQKAALKRMELEICYPVVRPRVRCDSKLTREIVENLAWWVLRSSPPASRCQLEVSVRAADDFALFRLTNRQACVVQQGAADVDAGPSGRASDDLRSSRCLAIRVAAELARLLDGEVRIVEGGTGFEFGLPAP